MVKLPELSKSAANTLAELIQHNRHLIRLMMSLSDDPSPLEYANGKENSDKVGIWVQKDIDGSRVFVRDMETKAQWWYWANVGRIDAKSRKKRIVLIGESVARGYLYDPDFNPALALGAILESYLGTDNCEVIDLARTNLTEPGLIKLSEQSLLLQPDVAVIFVGNNLRCTLRACDTVDLARRAREGGAIAFKEYLIKEMELHVTELVKTVSGIFESKGISVIWVLPEFNLRDWQDPPSDVPIVTYSDYRKWHNRRREAFSALARGDLEATSEFANDMIKIDHGSSACGPRLLREVAEIKHDSTKTRLYAESVRDADGWNPYFPYSPRPLRVTQDAIRREAARLKNVVVDLPKLFDEFGGGQLPGRELFLDYCHMTETGINVAMACVAKEILALLASITVSWDSCLSKKKVPPTKVRAETAFLAAIHNAHFYQSDEIVSYWCRRAVSLDPSIAESMKDFITVQSKLTPNWMCRSTERLLQHGSDKLIRYLMWSEMQRLDTVLMTAVGSSLEKHYPDLYAQLHVARDAEHAVKDRPKDLVDFFYCSSIPGPAEFAWTTRSFLNNGGNICSYCKAYWHESKFVFFLEKPKHILLKLTCRSPFATDPSAVRVDINSLCVFEGPVGPRWLDCDIRLDKSTLRDGPNEIIIHWPDGAFNDTDLLGAFADALMDGRKPDLYRVFGEVDSFTASPL